MYMYIYIYIYIYHYEIIIHIYFVCTSLQSPTALRRTSPITDALSRGRVDRPVVGQKAVRCQAVGLAPTGILLLECQDEECGVSGRCAGSVVAYDGMEYLLCTKHRTTHIHLEVENLFGAAVVITYIGGGNCYVH